MTDLRVAETDEELELWRSVRTALLPNERAASVAELRAGGNFLLLAYCDDELAGSGSASKSDTGGGAVFPRVLPAHRRHGSERRCSSGSRSGRGAWLRRHRLARRGRRARSRSRDASASSRPGARWSRFETVAADEPWPALPDGVELISVAERPGLLRRLY